MWSDSPGQAKNLRSSHGDIWEKNWGNWSSLMLDVFGDRGGQLKYLAMVCQWQTSTDLSITCLLDLLPIVLYTVGWAGEGCVCCKYCVFLNGMVTTSNVSVLLIQYGGTWDSDGRWWHISQVFVKFVRTIGGISPKHAHTRLHAHARTRTWSSNQRYALSRGSLPGLTYYFSAYTCNSPGNPDNTCTWPVGNPCKRCGGDREGEAETYI